jgi:hypothetical protein
VPPIQPDRPVPTEWQAGRPVSFRIKKRELVIKLSYGTEIRTICSVGRPPTPNEMWQVPLCAFVIACTLEIQNSSTGRPVRLSRDKVNKVAHVISDALADMNEVDFIEDRNTIRLEVRRILEELLNQEERIDQSARQKIENQKRTILEGSQEWDILYRKYYNEEVRKLGV